MKKKSSCVFTFTVRYLEVEDGEILEWTTQIEIPKNSRKMAARLGWMRFTTTVQHVSIVDGQLT